MHPSNSCLYKVVSEEMGNQLKRFLLYVKERILDPIIEIRNEVRFFNVPKILYLKYRFHKFFLLTITYLYLPKSILSLQDQQ